MACASTGAVEGHVRYAAHVDADRCSPTAARKEGGRMADTGEDREIKRRANAHEAELIRESRKLAATTKQGSAKRKSQGKVKRGGQSKSRA